MASSSEETSGPYAGHKNRLGLEKSPYLLQHADNPVDWYPWGDEAFKKAKEENKLIFLSVGYSTCHWCHVMERESFDNPDIGAILSQHFVPIKVDREERPDVDKVYMTFIQATTRRGGWPMNVWLTPALEPIVGGTYFPPDNRYGRPGFKTVLLSIAAQWSEKGEAVSEQGRDMLDLLRQATSHKPASTDGSPGEKGADSSPLPDKAITDKCYNMLAEQFEEKYGGFGTQPKFPHPANLTFLLAKYAHSPSNGEGQQALYMTLHTLRGMASGGMHDHVAQGFHRYSTDNEWHVPHFEKMLYDQAQLAMSYVDAYQITREEEFAEITRDILSYVGRDLSHKSGGFYSAEDADSLPSSDATEKKEGAFCVWRHDEVHEILSASVPQSSLSLADVFCTHYSIKSQGNVQPHKDPHGELEGQNVLIVRGDVKQTAQKLELPEDTVTAALQEGREKLYKARQQRPAPHLDNKMIASWNGLMVCGFSRAAWVLNEESYKSRVSCALTFLRTHMYSADTRRLLHSVYVGEDGDITQLSKPIAGFADDYAFVIWGLLEAYQTLQDTGILLWAEELQAVQDELFWDADHGGYFATASDDPTIMLRMKDEQDGAEPSTNSVSAANLLRLSLLLDRPDLQEQAERLSSAFTSQLTRAPIAMPHMCAVIHHMMATPIQIRLSGDGEAEDTQKMLSCIRRLYLPHHVLQLVPPGDASQNENPNTVHSDTVSSLSRLPQLSDIRCVDGKATAYVCRHQTCAPPVTSAEDLCQLLTQSASGKL